MTIKGYLIKAEDNSKTLVELPEVESQCLRALQGYCGGYVEAQHDAEGQATFWINEDGKAMRLPVNGLATAYWWLTNPMFRNQDVLVGDVVVTGGWDRNGRTMSIGAEMEGIVLNTFLAEED
jgi:hypothetical protein